MKSFYQFCLLKEQQVNQQNFNQPNQTGQVKNNLQQQQQVKNNLQQQQQQQVKNNQKPQNQVQQKPAVDVNQLNNTIAQLKKILIPLGVKF